MAHILLRFIAMSFAMLSTIVSTNIQAQQRIAITFKASDGMSFVETLRFRKEIWEGNASSPRTTSIESRSHYTVRKSPKGYSVFMKPVRPTDVPISEDVEALAAGLITSLRLRYDLDPQGQLMDVFGAEQAYAELENILPAEVKPVLSVMGITPNSMKQMAIYDWKVRDLFFVAPRSGKTLTVGQQFESPDALFPSAFAGALQAKAMLRSSGPSSCGSRQCVVLESTGISTDPKIGDAFGQMMSGIIRGMATKFAPNEAPSGQVPKFVAHNVQEKVRLERAIDVSTGLYHRYIQEHDATGVFSVDGSALPFRVTIKRDYTYTY